MSKQLKRDHENVQAASQESVELSEERFSQEFKRLKTSEDEQEQPIDPETKKVVNKLKELLKQVNEKSDKAWHSASSKQEEIREYCASLRTKVDAQSEIMIEEIREWNESTRDEINKYEKECLDKYNAKKFEASASKVKSLVEDVKILESKISQQLVDVTISTKALNKLIEETKKKLQDLDNHKVEIQKIKFSDGILELIVKDSKKFDPMSRASLDKFNVPGLDQFQTVTTIRDMPRFKSLLDCFINPFADSPELIAIVRTNPSKVMFVKMNARGEVVNKKESKLKISGVDTLQTVKECFIIQDENCNFQRFDYDFNEMKMLQDWNDNHIFGGFAANSEFIINIQLNEEDMDDSRLICFSPHDYSELCDFYSVDDKYEGSRMLANAKYLYIWKSGRNNVRVININNNEAKDRALNTQCSSVKLVGDKYVAMLSAKERKVRLYTQDDRLDFVKEFKVPVAGIMSQDCSSSFCFFDGKTGLIHHNLF